MDLQSVHHPRLTLKAKSTANECKASVDRTHLHSMLFFVILRMATVKSCSRLVARDWKNAMIRAGKEDGKASGLTVGC